MGFVTGFTAECKKQWEYRSGNVDVSLLVFDFCFVVQREMNWWYARWEHGKRRFAAKEWECWN